MQKQNFKRLIEWELQSLDSRSNPSLFDFLGYRSLLLLFFDLNDDTIQQLLAKAKTLSLENPAIQLIGIVTNNTATPVAKTQERLEAYNPNFPIFLDKDNKTKARYFIDGVPSWILSDKAGNIENTYEDQKYLTLQRLKDDILRLAYQH